MVDKQTFLDNLKALLDIVNNDNREVVNND